MCSPTAASRTPIDAYLATVEPPAQPTATRADEFAAAMRGGDSLTDIARREGVSREWIRQVVAAAGYSTRALKEEAQRALIERSMPRIEEMWADGVSCEEIARETGVRNRLVAEVTQGLPRQQRSMSVRRKMSAAQMNHRPKEEYLWMIRSLSEEIGWKTPGSAAFARRYSDTDRQMVLYHFGTWNAAIEQAGLTPHTVPDGFGAPTYSDEQVSAAVRRVAAIVGRVPTLAEYEQHRVKGEPSSATVRARVTGRSWLKAMDRFC